MFTCTPYSDIDCLTCAMFARQQLGKGLSRVYAERDDTKIQHFRLGTVFNGPSDAIWASRGEWRLELWEMGGNAN